MKAVLPQGGNDRVMTPDSLALAIVQHFNPGGILLEPCAGDGAFVRAFFSLKHCQENLGNVNFYEIEYGFDFLEGTSKADWVITNPPWSKFLAFLKHSMTLANDVVFLAYANAWFVKSRINAMSQAGFHFREFAYVANPKKPWPQFGLQLAAVHISREAGDCQFTTIDWKP